MEIWTSEKLNNQSPTIVKPLRDINHPKFKWSDPSKTDVKKTWRKARLLLRLNGEAYEGRSRIQLSTGY